MSVTISDISRAVSAFEQETVRLMDDAQELNKQMIELHERYLTDIKHLSSQHKSILLRIAANEHTVESLLKDSRRV